MLILKKKYLKKYIYKKKIGIGLYFWKRHQLTKLNLEQTNSDAGYSMQEPLRD
jgi:hypothetical protein